MYDSNEGNYLSAVLQAERDINQLSARRGVLANIPELSLVIRNVSSSGTREEAVRGLEEEGVSVILPSPSQTRLQVGGQEVEVGVSHRVTALAYLHTINMTSRTELLHVLPILRNDSQSLEMLQQLELQADLYPRLSLLPGVIHSPTLYTRSDTQDLVAAIIRQCVLVSQCDILVISLDHLDLLLQASLRTSLALSRWWVVEATQHEAAITAAISKAAQPTILTVEYVGHKREQFIMERFLASQRPLQGSVYREWAAYNTMVRLHRVLADLRASRQDWTDLNIEKSLSREAVEDRQDRFVLMSYKGQQTEVVTVPDIDWLMLGVLEVTKTDLLYNEMRSLSLTRQEVERMYEREKAECPEPEFVVSVTGSGVTPPADLQYSLLTLPEVLILPVSGQVKLSLYCPATTINYTCSLGSQPRENRDARGDMTCVLRRLVRRHKRGLTEEMSKIRTSVRGVVEDWQDLTPSVIGCYSSIAGNVTQAGTLSLPLSLSGCDFCFYFFASYNLSVSPGVCTPGCLMGTVGSCATLLTQVSLH